MYSEMMNASDYPQVTYNWIGITDDFFESVKDLSLGELLHDQLFGLFEAMSAIEMMDPKMDAGMVCNRGSKKALSFDQALEAGVLKIDNLSNSELIGVIDTTLACIVSWLEGHSLAQTVFTNLYLHRPYQIEDRVLKAFSLSVYKYIDIIKEFLVKGMVYEEEDFQSLQYGYRLNPDISEQRVIGMLREVEEELYKKCRTKQNFDDKAPSSDYALYSRIKFTRAFYQCLLGLLGQTKDEGNSKNLLQDCQRLLNICQDNLQIMQNTCEFGIGKRDDDDENIMGFEPLINQRLLPPTFPRYTKIKSGKEALKYFEVMISRMKQICKISSYVQFNSALDFFLKFSKSGACILSRSILQLLYISHGSSLVFGTVPFSEVLREACKNFIQPPTLVRNNLIQNNSQAKMYVDSFFNHCTRPFCILIQVCGHNRARQRDKLGNILEEFAAIQEEAERVDAFMHRLSLKNEWPQPHLACFGTWVLYYTLKVMIMYLLSGFELELYSLHEYYYIFWYLYEFLYGWLISALSRADSFILGRVDPAAKNQHKKSKNNQKRKNKNFESKYRREITYYQALQNMCGGYYKALFAFKMDKKIRMPHPQFDSEQIRYEHRFAPFAGLLTPPPVQYGEFRDMTSPLRYTNPQQPVDSVYLYIAGCKHFHQARSLLESLNNQKDVEIDNLLKICKTNFVVLKLLAGGHKKDSNVPPEFDFSINKHFPLIKLN